MQNWILENRSRLARVVYIRNPLARSAFGEFVGVFLLVLLGDGVGAQVTLGRNNSAAAPTGQFLSVAIGWGTAVAFAVLASGQTSPGHINPAISIAFMCIGKASPMQVLVFVPAQLLGAFLGSAVVYSVYQEHIWRMSYKLGETSLNALTTGGILTTWASVSHWSAFYDQVVATAILSYGILCIVDPKNFGIPSWAVPFCVGLLIMTIIGAFGLNCGAPINPARDIGPRFFMAICHWGAPSFTAKNWYFWYPNLGSILGAILGAFLYEFTVGLHLEDPGKANVVRVEDSEKSACLEETYAEKV